MQTGTPKYNTYMSLRWHYPNQVMGRNVNSFPLSLQTASSPLLNLTKLLYHSKTENARIMQEFFCKVSLTFVII